MTTLLTKQMLLSVFLVSGMTIAHAGAVMPEHLAKTQSFGKTTKFKSVPRQITKATEECAVLIQLPEDMQGWNPDICVACAPNQPLINPSGDYLYLTPGTYDIVARFIHSNPMSFTFSDYQGYIVLENVEVTGDMTIDVDPAKITNHIEFQPLLPNGDQLMLPVVNLDENGAEIPVSDGSMPFSGLTILDYVVGPGWGLDSSISMSPVINAETPWGFYDPTKLFCININDVSDRIHLGIGTWIGTPEYEEAHTLIMMAEMTGSKTGTISNDVAEYKMREFKPSWTAAGVETEKLIEDYPEELGWISPYGFTIRRVAGANNRLTTGAIRIESKSSDIYRIGFSKNKIDNPMVHLLVAPNKTELVKQGSNVVQTVNYGAWLQPFGEGEWFVYPQTSLAMTSDSPSADFPFFGVEIFSSLINDNEDEMFNTAPLVSTTINRGFNIFEGSEYLGFDIVSTGRMGETRNTDLTVMDAELKVNGVKVANSMEAIEEWWKGYDSEMAGETELKLTNSNFEIGGISASTVSTTHFNMTNVDFFPPSVTMMQVRTNEEKLSSCVMPGIKSTILVSAGDFESGNEMINYYGQSATVTKEPVSFNLWYALSGTDEWVELDSKKVNEEVITGIGVIYEAEFNPVIEGWNDIKIRVEDAAGNWQEQVIGMAINVSTQTGVAMVKSNGEVCVEGNNILAPVGSKIYTIDGAMTNGNDLTPGLYIVKTADSSVKVLVK